MEQNHLEQHGNSKRRLDDNGTSSTEPEFTKRVKIPDTHIEDDGRRAPQKIKLRIVNYTVGWICALPIELAASRAMLDNIHEALPTDEKDTNVYTLGNIGKHNIAMACLPAGQYGTNNAAIVASHMERTFFSMEIGLMVGIGGGAPGNADIRLGDIVVGDRVIQHDLGKILAIDGFQGTGTPRIPPLRLLNAVSKLRSLHESMDSQIPSILENMRRNHPKLAEYARPKSSEDKLFSASYKHPSPSAFDCSRCAPQEMQIRPTRPDHDPRIHYGGIASGNQVVKSGTTRDSLASKLDVLCFEMEAAGLVDIFPCVVIRGICDYSDSHKNKRWQKYAAATAASYARELISTIPYGSTSSTEESKEAKKAREERSRIEARRVLLLQSLEFDQMDARRADIAAPASRTCAWILQNPPYAAWLDHSHAAQHHGFLWISGKPGAGKSTLMKFLFERESNAAQNSEGDAAVLSFFFTARGVDLEKSLFGLYRSLLSRLLHAFPALQCVLDNSALIPPNQKGCPSVNSLKELLRNAISALGSRRLTCFIDALDECDETQVREMVVHFEELGEEALQQNIQLRICFSSRHYPHIDIRHGIKLTLEEQPGHGQDLAKYVQTHLRAGHGPKVDEIRSKILEKASGVFIWVILVVNILNKEFVRGRLFRLEQRLQEIPTELSNLFKDILRRDDENLPDTLLCFQWILFANRPLSRREFYFAVLSGMPENSQRPPTYDPESETDEIMDLFITSCSKGLAEVSKSADNTVQFIHESVNDFLVKDDGISQLWPETGNEFENSSHEILRDCCNTQIKSHVTSWIQRHRHHFHVLVMGKKVLDKFPFLGYAFKNVLIHANYAGKSFPQDAFLLDFALPHWLIIAETLGSQYYTRHDTLLYVLADKGFTTLLQDYIPCQPGIYDGGGYFGHPFFAALAWGYWSAARTFLGRAANACSNIELFLAFPGTYRSFFEHNGPKTTPINWAIQSGHSILLKFLMASSHFDCSALDVDLRSPIHCAAINGDLRLMKKLVEKLIPHHEQITGMGNSFLSIMNSRGNPLVMLEDIDEYASDLCYERRIQVIDSTDKFGFTPLSLAIKNLRESIIRQLLRWGADSERTFNRTRDLEFSDPASLSERIAKLLIEERLTTEWALLIVAAREGLQHIIRMIVDNDDFFSHSEYDGAEVLEEAARNNQEASLRLLLEKGASLGSSTWNSHGLVHKAASTANDVELSWLLDKGAMVNVSTFGETALQVASYQGHETTVKLLIEYGASLDEHDQHGNTALHRAATNAQEAMVALLLDMGAKPDRRNWGGDTPLHLASFHGHRNVVQQLIHNGSSLEDTNKNGDTPLHVACCRGREPIVELLIGNGARVDDRNLSGETPLHSACYSGHVAVVMFLLTKGADIDAQDHTGYTPLSQTSMNGQHAMAKLLLENGANVRTKNKKNQTPLHHAARDGCETMVKLLLANGADAYAVDKDGQTPRHQAVAVRSWSVVRRFDKASTSSRQSSASGSTAPFRKAHSSVSTIFTNDDTAKEDKVQHRPRGLGSESHPALRKEEKEPQHIVIDDTATSKGVKEETSAVEVIIIDSTDDEE